MAQWSQLLGPAQPTQLYCSTFLCLYDFSSIIFYMKNTLNPFPGILNCISARETTDSIVYTSYIFDITHLHTTWSISVTIYMTCFELGPPFFWCWKEEIDPILIQFCWRWVGKNQFGIRFHFLWSLDWQHSVFSLSSFWISSSLLKLQDVASLKMQGEECWRGGGGIIF